MLKVFEKFPPLLPPEDPVSTKVFQLFLFAEHSHPPPDQQSDQGGKCSTPLVSWLAGSAVEKVDEDAARGGRG